VLSLFGISQYHGELARAGQSFWLKYLFASQSAIMWMSALFVIATAGYWLGLAARSDFANRVSAGITWSAAAMGLIGLMVRWYESYLIGADVGHIPLSNLYEVFILFSIITALLYLYYEQYYQNRQLGAFVLPVISAAVAFLLWYTFGREAHHIQPLVPALQSYWMKIHVPANFVGYGAFALAAMVGVAYLLVHKGILANRLPALEVLDDVMYKAIAIGFRFLHHSHHTWRDVGRVIQPDDQRQVSFGSTTSSRPGFRRHIAPSMVAMVKKAKPIAIALYITSSSTSSAGRRLARMPLCTSKVSHPHHGSQGEGSVADEIGGYVNFHPVRIAAPAPEAGM